MVRFGVFSSLACVCGRLEPAGKVLREEAYLTQCHINEICGYLDPPLGLMQHNLTWVCFCFEDLPSGCEAILFLAPQSQMTELWWMIQAVATWTDLLVSGELQRLVLSFLNGSKFPKIQAKIQKSACPVLVILWLLNCFQPKTATQAAFICECPIDNILPSWTYRVVIQGLHETTVWGGPICLLYWHAEIEQTRMSGSCTCLIQRTRLYQIIYLACMVHVYFRLLWSGNGVCWRFEAESNMYFICLTPLHQWMYIVQTTWVYDDVSHALRGWGVGWCVHRQGC